MLKFDGSANRPIKFEQILNPKISSFQRRKSHIFISFRSQVIEKAISRSNFLDETITVPRQQMDY
jgi:hypothetical protein